MAVSCLIVVFNKIFYSHDLGKKINLQWVWPIFFFLRTCVISYIFYFLSTFFQEKKRCLKVSPFQTARLVF